MARKVIGPTGSRRRRWLFLCTSIAALATAAFFIAGAGATIGASTFEGNDGNPRRERRRDGPRLEQRAQPARRAGPADGHGPTTRSARARRKTT